MNKENLMDLLFDNFYDFDTPETGNTIDAENLLCDDDKQKKLLAAALKDCARESFIAGFENAKQLLK